MLIGNYNVFHKTPGRFYSGTTVSDIPGNYGKSGSLRNKLFGFNVSTRSDGSIVSITSIPSGYCPPYTWAIAQTAGEVAVFYGVNGQGLVSSSNLAGGKNGEATLAGSGQISDAAMGLIMSAVATLAGAGGITAAVAGKLEAVAILAGTGDLIGSLGALAGAIATLTGSGVISNALETAKGNVSADIYVNSGTASTKELATEIWNSIASEFNESGTMGNKLNAAGTAGDPWTTDLSSYDTDGTAGKKMKEVLTEDNFLGLK